MTDLMNTGLYNEKVKYRALAEEYRKAAAYWRGEYMRLRAGLIVLEGTIQVMKSSRPENSPEPVE